MKRPYALILIAACGGSYEPSGNTYAKVIDDRVEFEVFGDPELTVSIPGLPPAPISAYHLKKPSLPLDRFTDGENTIEITYEARGTRTTQRVTFTKPAGSGKPFLRLAECAMSTGTGSSDAAALDAGEYGQQKYCWLWSDGAIRIRVAGSSGATVTVGDVSATVGADGHAQLVYPVRPLLLRAPVRSAISDGAGVTETVPIRLTKGDAKLEGQLAIDLSSAAKALSRKLLAEGLPQDKSVRTRASAIYLPAEPYLGPFHVGKATALGEVGLVATARDTETRSAAKCGPYASTKGAPGDGMAPRSLIDIEVTVVDTTTGDEVGKRAFKAVENDCPMIATSKNGTFEPIQTRPDAKVVTAWLGELARK